MITRILSSIVAAFTKTVLTLGAILFFLGCNRPPTQNEIDQAASRILNLRMTCALITVELHGDKSRLVQNDDRVKGGLDCTFWKKDKDGSFNTFGFDEVEMAAINRFILIRNKK